MRARVVVIVSLALTGLGCTGLWAPEVTFRDVNVYECGSWDGWVDASAPFGGTLEVDVGPRQRQHTWTVNGEQEFHVSGRAAPGAPLALVARLEGAGASQVIEVPTAPLTATLEGALREDRAGTLTLRVDNPCGIPLDWTVTGLGVDASGRLAGSDRVSVPVPQQPAGALALALTVTGQGVVEVQREIHLVVAGPCTDNDHDGYSSCADEDRPLDCNDDDPAVHPAAAEKASPNGIDDNCDGRVDEGTSAYDDDGDGFSEDEGDCDDTRPSRHPGAVEVWDCRDQDCDGVADEGVTRVRLEDSHEPNDTRSEATQLGGGNSLVVEVDVVRGEGPDPEWFTFYSDDGLFDQWGLGVSAVSIPDAGRWAVNVYSSEVLRRSGTIAADGDVVWLSGKGGRSDSGTYWVEVVPQDVAAGCPATFRVVSR